MRATVFLAGLIFCLPALADGEALSRLSALLSGMREFEADFTQELFDERGESLQKSSGHLQVQHPGRFRWQTAEPFAQLVVSDGSTVWQYDPDLEQVLQRQLDKRADQLPSLLLSGDVEAVSQLYAISEARDGERESFEMKPLQEGGPFAALSVEFSESALRSLVIRDGMGQRTEIVFSAFSAVGGIDPGLFSFSPPPGADIVVDE